MTESWLERIGLHQDPGLQLDRDDTLTGPPAAALFSRPDRSGTGGDRRTYRYALTREWHPAPPAVFVMLNPSTADAFRLDPTLRRAAGFARAWGCGGLIVLNAYALRSTDPRELGRHPEPVGPYNDLVIGTVLVGYVGPVVVGWGADPAVTATGRAGEVLDLIRSTRVKPVCLGTTKGGHPRHPLYVAGSTIPSPYPPEPADADRR